MRALPGVAGTQPRDRPPRRLGFALPLGCEVGGGRGAKARSSRSRGEVTRPATQGRRQLKP